MKNKILIILSMILIILLNGCTNLKDGQDVSINNNENEELIYEEIVDKIIRFHVIANSDSDDDQALKLKVRDRVVEFISGKLEKSASLEESREIILNNKEKMEYIARDVIEENNYSYGVVSDLSKENFPDKVYGDVVFPQGEYEAYRIIIGDGRGANWWCVMFPPLCFVDGTKEVVDSSEIKKQIVDAEEELPNENIKEEKNKEIKEGNEDEKIIFKFKIFDFLFKK
ncbi:MAG: stage II sporulation protein R [Clostridium sp.]|uniref:stage II sporulation protein R n=1 Tax=Clostridium sp. TaxID=1506 RepID=UPI00290B3962|nr:stage II sporulation protein R [Clostridium sp.]MDU5109995.1 stage II sporulation protein R [Clostridium sp.]